LAVSLPFLEALLGVEIEANSGLIRDLEGDTVRCRLTEATRAYIGALAHTGPTVLVFDDLHWANEAWARAAEYSVRAGDQAMKVYALSEALDRYERACQAFEKSPNVPPERLADAILAWAPLALKLKLDAAILKRLAHAEQVARDLQDNSRLARALAWTAHAHALAGFPSRAVPILAESHLLATAVQ
jgi:tetratricopeptide (TPR) repeat protein